MQLGIFAKTFSCPTLEETLDMVRQHGLHCIQFNMACAGLPSMPDTIDQQVVMHIRAQAEARDITIAAVSGTFNMAHPDPHVRQVGLQRLKVLAMVCKDMGTSIITLCTGSRDPTNMWRWNDANTSPEAWHDLLETMDGAVQIADDTGVNLAFEPERANVVCTALRAHELFATISSPHLKVVLDLANLIDGRNQATMPYIVDEAFDLLGERIVIAHAKDRGSDDSFRAAGRGLLDYPHYLQCLASAHFNGPLIIHGLEEAEVSDAVRVVRTAMTCAAAR